MAVPPAQTWACPLHLCQPCSGLSPLHPSTQTCQVSLCPGLPAFCSHIKPWALPLGSCPKDTAIGSRAVDRCSGGWHPGINQDHEAGWLAVLQDRGFGSLDITTRQSESALRAARAFRALADRLPLPLGRSTDSCVGGNSRAPSHELMSGCVPNPAVHGFGMCSLGWPASVPPSRHSKCCCLLLALQSQANSKRAFF